MKTGKNFAFKHQQGLSIVELMISLALGLLLTGALVGLFVNNSASRRQLDRAAEVLETGNYAINYLRREISLAGYYGILGTPTGEENKPCAGSLEEWRDSLNIHASGSNDIGFSCLPNAKATDAIFIQRSSTCSTDEMTKCTPEIEGKTYIQVSECGDQKDEFVISTENSEFTKKSKNCDAASTAKIRRYFRKIFYVSNDNKLIEINITAMLPLATLGDFTISDIISANVIAKNDTSDDIKPISEITDGIESIQFEYGIDENGDGAPEKFTSTPTNTEWKNVIGVQAYLLARSLTEDTSHTDTKTYTLGDKVIAAANDHYRRRVFSTYINLNNPQGRRE